MSAYVAGPRPVTVVVAGAVGIGLAVASVVLPYAAYLRRPDLIALVAGLAVIGSGLALLRVHALGPAGWLVLGAGYAWFLPALAVSDHTGLDRALSSTAFLHLALLVHAVVVVGARTPHGGAEWVAVSLGYLAALTAVVGYGYRLALPAAGVAVAVAVLHGDHRRRSVRRWRLAAGLVLGVGLFGDALLRQLVAASWRPETWIAVDHPVEFAVAAVLVALAGTRRTAFDVIDVRADSLAQLTTTLATELRAPALRIALSDGVGGWLRPGGEAWGTAPPAGAAVNDASGTPCAVLEGALGQPVTPAIQDVLRLAAANARLRRSIVVQVDELDASRRRLLSAADWERASLGAQLRTRVITHVATMERELARSHELSDTRTRATTTRRALETIARGIDPLGRDGSLRAALQAVVTTAPCEVVVERCDEPRSQDVARALWFCGAEAASNTAKYAGGATLRIAVRRNDETVVASFVDDGPGGADPSGAGIRGLTDRVETLGGALHLSSPANGGTSLEISLPDGAEDCGQPQGALPADPDPLVAVRSYRQGDRLPGGTR